MRLHENRYLGTERCGLCRLKLPWDDDLSDLEPWESTFRAALRLCSDKDVVRITNPSSFPSDYSSEVDVTFSDGQSTQSITIHNWNRGTQESKATAFCFHDFCYSYIIKFKGCTNSKIYQLARTLLQDSVAPEDIYSGRALESKIRNTFPKLVESNPYSTALFPMQQLPIEIRNIIWEYVDLRTAASAFIIVTGETLRLAKSLNWPDRREISLDLGSQISLKTISVFGTLYIQAFEHRDITYTITGVVDRLSFVMVLGGICAIKLFGTGWDSGWLGKIPVTRPVWYGTIPEIGPGLTCSFNDLHCTRISGLGVITSQVLWNQPTVPVSLTLPRAANLHLDQPRPDLISSPQPRYFRYLPLFEGNEYAMGLLIYHSGNGIVGLEAHFTRTSRLSGIRRGCSIYFPLGLKERIDFVWRRVYNKSPVNESPALIIHTTLGRTCLFGSYVLPGQVQDDKYEWIPFNIRGYVTGFYFETPTTTQSITRLGVTSFSMPTRPTTHPTPGYIVCNMPRNPAGGADAGLYLSVARLSGLKEVRLCQLGSRCTGIMIHYLNSPPVVLGQWHTSCLSRHTSIDVRDVSTMHVKRTQSRGYYIVSDITFLADKNRDGKPDTFSINEPIAWWFSKLSDDICPWRGKVLPVPRTSIRKT